MREFLRGEPASFLSGASRAYPHELEQPDMRGVTISLSAVAVIVDGLLVKYLCRLDCEIKTECRPFTVKLPTLTKM